MNNAVTSRDNEQLTDCARLHRTKSKSFSQKKLKQKQELPCGCEEVAIEDLLSDYQCQECNETYFYSFCWGDVVQESETWHCISCGKCRDASEWHCKRCNECTYGLTLNCENCGRKSPYMP